MATILPPVVPAEVEYPDSDGKPMAETPQHRKVMTDMIEGLEDWYAGNDQVYISGNMFIYYVRGDARRHVSPDVFVTKDVPKLPERRRYLVWEEGKAPDLVVEVTSPPTRDEDLEQKFALYRDVLRVREYFLFDPYEEYLEPPLQGYRLIDGQYVPIQPVEGRLPSEVLGLHLERHGEQLRLYNPATGQWLPTRQEVIAQARAARQQEAQARQQAEAARQQEAQARQQAEAARQQEAQARQQAEAARRQEAQARQQAEAAHRQEAQARQQAEAEIARLRLELESFRQQAHKPP
jgi:Uma2 family endonuclease